MTTFAIVNINDKEHFTIHRILLSHGYKLIPHKKKITLLT
jgi:hypothetical protein